MQREGFVKSNGQDFMPHPVPGKRGGIGLKEAVGERTVSLGCRCLSGHTDNRQMIRLEKTRELFDSESRLTDNRTKRTSCNLIMVGDSDATERCFHLSKDNVTATLMVELISDL